MGPSYRASVGAALQPRRRGHSRGWWHSPAARRARLRCGDRQHETGPPAADGANYLEVTGSVNVTVSKATPTITWPIASDIRFGQALSSSVLVNGLASVPGEFAFTTPATVPPLVGRYNKAITFTPTFTTNYNTLSSAVDVMVNPPLSVRIKNVVGVSGYYLSIMDALSPTTVSDHDIIEMMDIDITENIEYNSPNEVTLKGGFSSAVYNHWYSGNTGITTLHGTLTVKKGKLNVQKLVLTSAP